MSIDVSKYNPNEKAIGSSSNSAGKKESTSMFSFKKFSDKKREAFYSDFSMLIVAGMDINNALNLLSEENDHSKGLPIFQEIHKYILTGKSFADSMKEAGQFSSYEYRSVEIGESTGKLGHVLELLYAHYKRKNELKGQMVKVFSYPIMIILATIGVLVFMMNYVVPLFLSVVEEFDAELPWITKFVMNVSDGMKAIYLPAGIIIAAVFLLVALTKNSEAFKKLMAKVKFRIPIFGKLIQRVYLARFCQGMYLVTSSKIPLVEGLDMMENIVDDYTIQKAIPQIRQDILQGTPLYLCLAKHKIFEKRMVSLVRVGEEVNQLDQTFTKLAEQFNRQVETRTENLKTLLEPILMLVIGAIVGVISLAMILPIFEISATMKV